MKRFVLHALGILTILSPVGATVFTADSVEFSDVQTAVDDAVAAGPGNTVAIPAGSAAWGNNQITVHIPIAIIGAGRDLTTITSTLYSADVNNLVPVFYFNPTDRTVDGEYRLEGVTIDGQMSAGLGSPVYMDQGWGLTGSRLIVGLNRIKNYPGSCTAIRARGQIRGVVYKNEIIDCAISFRVLGYNDLASEWVAPALRATALFGTDDTLVYEENETSWTSATIDWLATQTCGGSPCPDTTNQYSFGWIEIGQSGRVVIRFNRWDYAPLKGTFLDVIDIHGSQSWGLFKKIVTADAGTDEFTAASHGFSNNNEVRIASTGAVPAGLDNTTTYYVVNAATDTFQVSATLGGAAINLTNAGSGTITARKWAQDIVGQTSTMVAEIYGNEIVNHYGDRWGIIRGGQNWIHNNSISTLGGAIGHLYMQQYGHVDEDVSCGGVPDCKNGCMDSVAASGTDFDHQKTVFNAELTNTYCCNNLVNGVEGPMTATATNACPNPENVDFRNFNPNFDDDAGQEGIGRGTVPPVTVHPDGSGYWVASTATNTQDSAIINGGDFYKVIAGAWVLYAQPLHFPHYMRSDLAPEAPSNSLAPSITGYTINGQTLTGHHGLYSGSPLPSKTMQWQVCASDCSGCVDIEGETDIDYLLEAADIGTKLKLVETATNSEGEIIVSSSCTGTVGPQPVMHLPK